MQIAGGWGPHTLSVGSRQAQGWRREPLPGGWPGIHVSQRRDFCSRTGCLGQRPPHRHQRRAAAPGRVRGSPASAGGLSAWGQDSRPQSLQVENEVVTPPLLDLK